MKRIVLIVCLCIVSLVVKAQKFTTIQTGLTSGYLTHLVSVVPPQSGVVIAFVEKENNRKVKNIFAKQAENGTTKSGEELVFNSSVKELLLIDNSHKLYLGVQTENAFHLYQGVYENRAYNWKKIVSSKKLKASEAKYLQMFTNGEEFYCLFKNSSRSFEGAIFKMNSSEKDFTIKYFFNKNFGDAISVKGIPQRDCVYLYVLDKKSRLVLHKLTKSLNTDEKYAKDFSKKNLTTINQSDVFFFNRTDLFILGTQSNKELFLSSVARQSKTVTIFPTFGVNSLQGSELSMMRGEGQKGEVNISVFQKTNNSELFQYEFKWNRWDKSKRTISIAAGLFSVADAGSTQFVVFQDKNNGGKVQIMIRKVNL